MFSKNLIQEYKLKKDGIKRTENGFDYSKGITMLEQRKNLLMKFLKGN